MNKHVNRTWQCGAVPKSDLPVLVLGNSWAFLSFLQDAKNSKLQKGFRIISGFVGPSLSVGWSVDAMLAHLQPCINKSTAQLCPPFAITSAFTYFHSINESMNHSTNKKRNESMNQWTKESMNKWINEPMNHPGGSGLMQHEVVDVGPW